MPNSGGSAVNELENPWASWWSVPNLLSLSRIPLGILVFVFICYEVWLACLVVFVVATATDWLDGWWARRFNRSSPLGRSLDPLTDKFLICGTFIYLQSANVGILPWMVVLIVGRELFITGLRGIVEANGIKFGADWFGKLKTGLQCAVIIALLAILSLGPNDYPMLKNAYMVLLYGTLAATVGSGVQYCLKAARLLG
jgi:CDP-diacylglycerol---glycerol-3-phosphate 3-phosphatidyltransferase